MHIKKTKKRAVTLIEIMIVILLIGLISGALAFNMRGSADKGRIFKTEQNCERIYDALMMAYACGDFDLNQCTDRQAVKAAIEKTGWLKNVDNILKDAWGKDIIIDMKGDDDLDVYSEKLRKPQNAPAH